ncbi:MAG TPA: prenyltransferase [bacterium]|nr:prenyltransferase [bacterium]
MGVNNSIKIWLSEIRANFLVLAVVLVMIGGAGAFHDGSFNPVIFVVTVIGVVFAHISVDLFNEYSDWKTGIDERTERTPFSGGSGNLQKGLLQPSQVHTAAWITLIVAFIIGLGLAWVSGWQVLILMAAGGIAIIFYTDYFAKWIIGELISGITLGSFVVLGSYFVQTGEISHSIIWASIPPGILTSLLLLLNEFPDVDADRAGGRRHIIILLGRRAAAVIYSVMLMLVFLFPVLGIIIDDMPYGVLISFLTFPLAVYIIYRVFRYGTEIPMIIPALGMNVIVVLATDFLMAVGYLIG